MLDIHAHLYWESYDSDRAEVIQRARAAGVKKIICVASTAEESKLAVALAAEYDLKASVGIHPEFFNAEKEYDYSQILKNLRIIAQDEKVVAIGECGLEYFSHTPGVTINPEQKERQKKGFLMQIELAQELKLPLIVHCRDAYKDVLGILISHISSLTSVVMHCYMGDTAVTKKFLELPDVYFSFTGNITYPVKKEIRGTSHDLQETVKLIPLERLFVETDCPFLAPQRERGKRNEPAFVRHVLEKVAEIKQADVKEVENMVEENYSKVFKV